MYVVKFIYFAWQIAVGDAPMHGDIYASNKSKKAKQSPTIINFGFNNRYTGKL